MGPCNQCGTNTINYKNLCNKCYGDRWRKNNKAKIKQYNHSNYYVKGHRHKPWADLTEEQRLSISKRVHRYRVLRKFKVINKYGGKCVECGCAELAFLSIDHVNDDGNLERKHTSNTKFYAKLLKSPLREDLQVLCMNHQFGKRIYGNGTPVIFTDQPFPIKRGN
jgi:hypothetical protein